MPLLQATPFLPSPIRPLIRTDFPHLPRSPRFQCSLSPSLRHQLHLRPRQALPVPIPPPGGRMKFHCAAASCAAGGSAAVDCDERARLIGFFARCGLGLAAALIACGLFAIKPRRVFAADVVGSAVLGLKESSNWPKILQVLTVFKEQGLVLAVLLGLSAFFSMAETSITTLWPWKVRELAEKEPENGVFRMLNSDVTRFLTTILIGTT